jgi:signal transduction histidine kinase
MWICLLIAVLTLIIILLIAKVCILIKSAQEIKTAFEEKIQTETNTLISISSHDSNMCALADSINIQLKKFYTKRQRYEQGDLELKEAIINISHDLRTPLTAIYGYLQLLKPEQDIDTIKQYLGIIENRTIALKQLTDELFNYTIVTSENKELILEEISINAVLEECISSYYAVLKKKRIIPNISIPEKKVMRWLNKNALARIFSNIISNAIKYTDGDFTIALFPHGDIIFSNHTTGLTGVQAANLFDRFYTVTTARKSTGLGLSIAKTLTEQMGGNISARYHEDVLSIHICFLCSGRLTSSNARRR